MKILLLTQDFPPNPGGIAVFLYNLCSQLCRLGHRVDVLTPFREGCQEVDSGQPYYVHRYTISKRVSLLIPLWQTLSLYRRNRYDIVFVGHFMATHALGTLLLCKLWRVPYVILSHGNDLSDMVSTRIDEMVAELLLCNATMMLGNSRFTAERIRQIGYQGPIEVLKPGVNMTQFHPGVDAALVRKKYGLDGHCVLFTVARLIAKKNVDGVLRALPQVIKEVPDVLYLVAGNGEERDRFEALCDEMGLRPYVRFLGNIENRCLPALYCASELYVMPTKGVESFGISFVEANACGKPVIGGRSGGTADAVADGETGILVDPQDTDEIASAIVRLLTDKKLARRLGETGHQRVEQEFSWEQVGKRLEIIFHKYLLCVD